MNGTACLPAAETLLIKQVRSCDLARVYRTSKAHLVMKFEVLVCLRPATVWCPHKSRTHFSRTKMWRSVPSLRHGLRNSYLQCMPKKAGGKTHFTALWVALSAKCPVRCGVSIRAGSETALATHETSGPAFSAKLVLHHHFCVAIVFLHQNLCEHRPLHIKSRRMHPLLVSPKSPSCP